MMTDQAERTVKNDVLIPMMQSFWIGFCVGCATAAGAYLYKAGALFAWWVIGASVGGMISYAAKTSSFTMPRVEMPVRQFADEVTINIADYDVPFPKGHRRTISYQHKLPAMARAIKRGASFSYADMVGPGKVYTRPEFELVRRQLIDLHLVEWKDQNNHARGLRLRRGFHAIVDKYASTPVTSPLPKVKISPGVRTVG